MALTLAADSDRIAQLKALGEQLQDNAQTQVGENGSVGARRHLAAVRSWAAGLDQDAYALSLHDEGVLIQQIPDAEVDRVLGASNAALRRTNEAIGLTVRHGQVHDSGGRAPDLADDALASDLVLAKSLWDDLPEPRALAVDGPIAAAASALELHLTSRATVSKDALVWSAEVLLQVAADAGGEDVDFDDSIFAQGADRSAGRALPLLLLPSASAIRSALSVRDASGVDELLEISRAVAVTGANETRLAYARGLDVVWQAPCDTAHLFGRCHHQMAFDLVTESYLRSHLGAWDVETQRRPVAALDPPNVQSLDALTGGEIVVSRLTAALRATSSAAISSACCAKDAQQALRSLLAAHQRAMLASKHGYHHSQSDALVAARAALWQTIGGRDELILGYVRRYLSRARPLAEALQAIVAAAEERTDAGSQAQRLWPAIMELVLDAAEADAGLFSERTWGNYAEAALIPNPGAEWGYLTTELVGEPHRWRALLEWAPQVQRWLNASPHSRTSIDRLVIAIRELDVSDQIEQGLKWIERIVSGASENDVATYNLPEWLRELRTGLVSPDHIARWQRVVDRLIVAGDARVADLAD